MLNLPKKPQRTMPQRIQTKNFEIIQGRIFFESLVQDETNITVQIETPERSIKICRALSITIVIIPLTERSYMLTILVSDQTSINEILIDKNQTYKLLEIILESLYSKCVKNDPTNSQIRLVC